MATKNKISFIPLTSIASSALTASYQAVNSGGLPNACATLSLRNDTNQDITISFDGSTDHEYVVANSSLTLSSPFSVDSPVGRVNTFNKGLTVSAKGTAGTGTLYISGTYIPSS